MSRYMYARHVAAMFEALSNPFPTNLAIFNPQALESFTIADVISSAPIVGIELNPRNSSQPQLLLCLSPKHNEHTC